MATGAHNTALPVFGAALCIRKALDKHEDRGPFPVSREDFTQLAQMAGAHIEKEGAHVGTHVVSLPHPTGEGRLEFVVAN